MKNFLKFRSFFDITRTFLNVSVNFKKIIFNIGWLAFEKIVRLVLGVIVSVMVVRYLGPNNYGMLSYSISFINLFLALVGLGLDNIVIREIAKDFAKRETYLGTAFYLRFMGGILAFFSSILTINLVGNDSIVILLVTIMSFSLIFRAFDVIDFWFQSQTQSKYSVIARNSSFFLFSILKILLIISNSPLIHFSILFSLESIITGIFFILVYYKNGQNFKNWKFNFKTSKLLIKESWPLIIGALATSVYYNVDQILIGNMLDKKEVGIYSAAVKFSEIWYVLPVIIYSSVLPTMTKLKNNDITKFYKRFSQLSVIMFYIPLFFAIIMTFSSKILINIIYGITYLKSADILIVHIWSSIFVFIGILFSIWTMIYGFQKFILVSTVSGAIINIILDIMLIPSLGVLGPAFATVFAYAFANYFVFLIFHKSRFLVKTFTKAIFSPILSLR
jgi:PST family polysaccharide transporter